MVATFPLGFPLLGCAVCVLIQLKNGLRQAAVSALVAVCLLTALAAFAGYTPGALVLLAPDADSTLGVAVYSTVLLGVAVGIGYLLVTTGSVTLAAQLMLVTTAVGLALVNALGPDAQILWGSFLNLLRENMAARGMTLGDEEILGQIAPLMTASAAGMTWLAAMLAMFLGYAAFRLLPDAKASYGRFQNLNLGRVLAALTVVVSLLATVTDSPFPMGTALVLIMAFTLQGFALCHWMVERLRLSRWLLMVLYVAIIVTAQTGILLLMLSVLGYVDAWFDLRRRFTPGQTA